MVTLGSRLMEMPLSENYTVMAGKDNMGNHALTHKSFNL